MRIESPSSYKIKNKYLEMEYNHARKITNFIYNHGWLLAQMKKYCGGDIVQLGVTRFATNYIALDSLLKKNG